MLDEILIREGEGQYESLTLALQAVAAAERVELDYDDLCAALGVSFAAVSTDAVASPGWWLTYGRDAFLEPAARLFCIELRDLHPPDVGVDMLAADEFSQHFEASYEPLILRALENGQPVLALQGWPDFRSSFWGVITGQTNAGFEGTTLWSGGERQRLVAPAVQCYVVERCEPVVPRRSDLFAMAMRHADTFLNRAPFAAPSPAVAPSIVTGPAAFDAWEEWLESGEFGDPDTDASWNEHRQHAEFIAASRDSAARFLRRIREVASKDLGETVDQAIACCESVVDRLADSRDESKVRSLFATSRGREKLLQAIHAAEADDRRLGMHVEQLA